MLLLTFPELKCDEGPVTSQLQTNGASPDVLKVWSELVNQEMYQEDDEY